MTTTHYLQHCELFTSIDVIITLFFYTCSLLYLFFLFISVEYHGAVGKPITLKLSLNFFFASSLFLISFNLW